MKQRFNLFTQSANRYHFDELYQIKCYHYSQKLTEWSQNSTDVDDNLTNARQLNARRFVFSSNEASLEIKEKMESQD
mgnify:FL=1